MAKIGPVENYGMSFDGGSDYATACARCHGGDGKGQTAKGRQTHAGDLTKSRISDAKGIRIITNGSGEMPAFKNSMSAGQIREVMAYIHGFRQ
jgi:cytochrome c6